MLRLHNAVPVPAFRLDHPVASRIFQFAASISLNDTERTCVDYAMLLVDKALVAEGMQDIQMHPAVYFTADGTLSLSFCGEQYMGMYQPIIILPVQRWRDMGYGPLHIIVCVLEEFCHCLWCILDENIVKDKVAQLVQQDMPSLTRQALYEDFECPSQQ